jgi:hypothetical protein
MQVNKEKSRVTLPPHAELCCLGVETRGFAAPGYHGAHADRSQWLPILGSAQRCKCLLAWLIAGATQAVPADGVPAATCDKGFVWFRWLVCKTIDLLVYAKVVRQALLTTVIWQLCLCHQTVS